MSTVCTQWKPVAGVATGCALVLALSACSPSHTEQDKQDPAGSAAPHASADGGLVLYYEQQWYTIGPNPYRKDYRGALAGCSPGGVGHRLTPKQVAKLGTQRKQFWLDGNRRSAELDETWGVATGFSSHKCQFLPVHKATLTISYPDGRVYTIDMVHHKGKLQNVGAENWGDRPIPPPRPDWSSVKGWLKDGGQSSQAGQPCTIIKKTMGGPPGKGGECVWSGGRKWGFAVLESSTPVLRKKASNGETDMFVDKFVIGHLSDAQIFNVPNHVKIVGDGGQGP